MDQFAGRPVDVADRRVVVLDEESFEALLRVLDRPARRIPSLVELFQRTSPFES